ncbi:hypothetical protein [Microtetraspora sp. NBRC 13810]|uniref:hypothetical protein n=1 Tax=Microtetraspora sp. NBRC 13810 TaxID=3030990 RepID=UPI0025527500|nr:hypothetical protein [Microtetraspora sp. NBRC 13810]
MSPYTGRARLGYDRARVLLGKYAGLDLHQLRHSAATHLGDAEVPLQLIMAKTRHKSPACHALHPARQREAIAAVTEHLAPPADATNQQEHPAGVSFSRIPAAPLVERNPR